MAETTSNRWNKTPRAPDDLKWLLDRVDKLASDRNNAIHAPCSLYLRGDGTSEVMAAVRSANAGTVKQHGMRPDDEQFAQVPIAHLRNTAELRLAARRVLLGRQSEKGGELARPGETGHILNGRRHRRGDDRAEAGNAHQPARRFIR